MACVFTKPFITAIQIINHLWKFIWFEPHQNKKWDNSCEKLRVFRGHSFDRNVHRRKSRHWKEWQLLIDALGFSFSVIVLSMCVCLHTSHPNPFLWIFIILFGWSVWWCCARRLPSKLHSAICSIRCCVYWAVCRCRSATIANRCAWCARHYCTVTIIGAIIRIGYIVGIVAAGVVCGVCFIHIRIIYIG